MKLTKEQQKAVKRKWLLNDQGISFLQFRRGVQSTIGCARMVVVQWSGMWLTIEADGYTHT